MIAHGDQSLRSKWQAFTDDLTPNEAAQLRAIRPDDTTGHLLPTLREKVQRTVATLTPEEAAHLRRVVEADTAGYMKAQYGSGEYKVAANPTMVNPQYNPYSPESNYGAGGNFDAQDVVGWGFVFGSLLATGLFGKPPE
jgi:hypothetical protein